MSSREFSEWMAFHDLEPFGEERADLRAGIVASTVANANRDPKKKRKAYKPEDFMPKFKRTTDRQRTPWQSQLKIVEMLNAAMGGRDLRSKPEEDRK
jgi:hypothetical protein